MNFEYIQFLGEIYFRKGKVCCYWIIFLCRVIKNEVLLINCSFSYLFFSLKDKKLKKLAVALKFVYFLTVLSLNSNVFCLFYLLVKIPLHCMIFKRRNHLKTENLETLFLLSALQMPIKSVTSYQAEIKYLEEA